MWNQIKEFRASIIVVVSLIAFGFLAYPAVEKVAKPLREIAETLESMEHKIDSLSHWTELRFRGSDVEIIVVKERIAANQKLIEILAREN